MINYLLLVVVPNLQCFFGFIGCVGLAASFGMLVVWLCKKAESINEDDEKSCRAHMRNVVVLFCFSLVFMMVDCFIPNKQEIIELKALDIIAELKGVDQVPQKIIDKLNDLLGTESE